MTNIITKGTRISHLFEMQTKNGKRADSEWYHGTVLDFKQDSGYAVLFERDRTVHELPLEPNCPSWQFLHQKLIPRVHNKTIKNVPIAKPINKKKSTNQTNQTTINDAFYEQLNDLSTSVTTLSKKINRDPLTSDPKDKTINCIRCRSKNIDSKVKYILATGYLKAMLDPDNDISQFKSFITKLKKTFGRCVECCNDGKYYLRFDEKRFTYCAICRAQGKTKNNTVPICSTCNNNETDSSENLLKRCLAPAVSLLNSSANSKYHTDAKLNTNSILFQNLPFRPDGTFFFSYNKDNARVNVLFIIEIDKDQHNSYLSDTARTLAILNKFKLSTEHHKCILFRVNTSEFIDKNDAQPINSTTIFDRLVIMRCWIMFFIIHIEQVPSFITLYLFYSFNNTKIIKCHKKGFVGKAYNAPLNDLNHKNSWIYGVDLVEGQPYNDNKLKGYSTFGKVIAHNRVSVNDVFDHPNVMEQLWDGWNDTDKRAIDLFVQSNDIN
jgi:hypothetical protein